MTAGGKRHKRDVLKNVAVVCGSSLERCGAVGNQLDIQQEGPLITCCCFCYRSDVPSGRLKAALVLCQVGCYPKLETTFWEVVDTRVRIICPGREGWAHVDRNTLREESRAAGRGQHHRIPKCDKPSSPRW